MISVGDGERIGMEGVCEGCGVHIDGPHAIAGRTRGPESPEVAERAFREACERPNLSDLRESIAIQRLEALNYEGALSLTRGASASITAVWQFVFIAGSFVAAIALNTFFDERTPASQSKPFLIGCISAAVAALSLGISIWRMVWKRKACLLPRIAKSLAPLRLRQAELDDVMAAAKLKNLSVVAQTDVVQLRDAIAMAQARLG